MADIDVTVVIGAYNSMPYVTKSVTSVLGQTIGLDRLELIAVDDGSTDGTGEELDRLAESSEVMRVVHQPNSGGPAGPRNVGIELARGRYVLFLDADDYLGPEALERMVSVADRNGSDVVVGRMAGVGGRKPPRSMFRENQDKVDLFASRIWWTLSAQKLFRKSLIDRLGLRFPNLKIGQDQPFTGRAYLAAGTISVIADYDCYYIVTRDDGGNNTKVQRDPRDRLPSIEVMIRMVAEHVQPGEQRDALMERHFYYDLIRGCFGARYLAADDSARKEVISRAKALVEAYLTPGLAERAPVGARRRFELIQKEDTEGLADLIREEQLKERTRKLNRRILEELRIDRVAWSDVDLGLTLSGTYSGTGSLAILLNGTIEQSHRVPVSREGSDAFEVILPLSTFATRTGGHWEIFTEISVDGAVATEPVPLPQVPPPRMWWQTGHPMLVVPRQRGGKATLSLLPLLSLTTIRKGAAALRRKARQAGVRRAQ